MSCVDELLALLLRPVRVFLATNAEASIESILRRRYECEIIRGDNVTGADLLILDSVAGQAEQLVSQAQRLDIPVLVLWNDAESLLRLARIGAVGALAHTLNAEDFEHIFKALKIHAREREASQQPALQFSAG